MGLQLVGIQIAARTAHGDAARPPPMLPQQRRQRYEAVCQARRDSIGRALQCGVRSVLALEGANVHPTSRTFCWLGVEFKPTPSKETRVGTRQSELCSTTRKAHSPPPACPAVAVQASGARCYCRQSRCCGRGSSATLSSKAGAATSGGLLRPDALPPYILVRPPCLTSSTRPCGGRSLLLRGACCLRGPLLGPQH
jgi:hypothetical protein